MQDIRAIRSAIRATRVSNITENIQELVRDTKNKNINRNNMTECCRYPYQLLDTYCASLDKVCVFVCVAVCVCGRACCVCLYATLAGACVD